MEKADYNGGTLRAAFEGVIDFVVPSPPGPPWESDFLEALYSLLWQLAAEGVIRPGSLSLAFPFITVTEYGKRVINNENAHPHDVLSVSFLVTAKSLLEAPKDSNEQAKFRKLLDRQPMKPKQDWVHARLPELDENRNKLPMISRKARL